MGDPESRPSERKIAALLLIAVVTAAIGLYSYSQESPQINGIIGSVKDKLSLTGFSLSSQTSDKAITLDGSLSFDVAPEIALNMQAPANNILLSLSGENTVTIDKMPWQFQDGTTIDMKNYTGKATLGKTVSVSGSAKSIRINLASQSSSERGIAIDASGAKAKSVMLTGVKSINLDIKNITGNIKANDGKNAALYAVTNNRLSISGFSGDIEFYGDKITLRGKGKLNADLIESGR